ncbi:ribosome assembly RNA-binding protein YhbY [Francisella philomiragia]|uniref:ribosome assembly RNA-binding protein YhbY n=1 Tax=Francisella philomiragia TaxID=28110 RepID=UPI0019073EE0|nr:ribosome assembly RNA-binding protein YhbY [Francisella philomiragia]MBK2256468.1 ribosome assembly RNA-binding protein YhbY [Francisella philomiragia]MBK2269126.1 ribosome assembly RNA-binding protein YhbY [Francisella philomiragia]MBK2270400.1 ribosome assembly RNA-binding protein YhbY [Francisella philomiragia]MBK2274179.1 ribosome assembly RNA-binding protein YhbY [Francisella philomiragia]MBK2293773.1 ribosome assembly RNA-binding protein YhbY [Francisella philomiragia]
MDVKQQQNLKAQAHTLKPVVLMGEKGLTENVMLEIDLALASHELIKVKAGRLPKQEKQEIAAEIVKATKSELVQIIGNILVLYRRNPNIKKK